MISHRQGKHREHKEEAPIQLGWLGQLKAVDYLESTRFRSTRMGSYIFASQGFLIRTLHIYVERADQKPLTCEDGDPTRTYVVAPHL